MHDSSLRPARPTVRDRRIATGTRTSMTVGVLLAGSGLAALLIGRNRQLMRQLHALTAQLDSVRRSEQERVHDAGSATAAILGAAELLCSGRAGVTATRLQSLLVSETRRLHRTLSAGPDEPMVDFDVRALLEQVVLAAELGGARVRLAPTPDGGVRAVGLPDATATVIANLLTNATRHAPGAHITVHARRIGSHVTIVVDDDGPGLAVADPDRLRRRGVRGPRASAGSGLGLYTADREMLAQSGSLLLGRGPAGGTRVALRLPATPAAPVTRAS